MDAQLDRLFHHLEWANARLLDSLDPAAPLPVALPAEVLRLLGHVLGAERVWLDRIEGVGEVRANPWPELTLAQARELAAVSAVRFRTLVRSASPERLAAPIAYQNSRGEAFRTGLRDILLHVAMHGAHHRGQIAALLRRAGLEPVDTGFIIFARAGHQAPADASPRELPGPGGDPEPGPIGI